ncbi:mandelate racemase/muconate lactonizing enzyme family protein [Actinopolymorpha alba]|uniref:mandelate racemase/muconate lactonizing enzyme family protein n=1 Tax=Actinopolymorpha alba TaxID=533267 RepID=UPI00037E61D3|nr:enolase C-terminal domain-like protein [Actinopolymorpha alba]
MARITRVRLTAINTPRTSGLVCGHVIVELLTDVDGLIGVGEMSDLQHLPRFHVDVEDLERTLTAILSDLDPLNLNEASRRLEESFPQAGNLYDKSSVIKCGVDIAIWDLVGKLSGRSVSDLLGGRVRESLPIAYPIFRQRTARDVEANLELVAAKLADGFSRFRVYVGRELQLDEQFLRRARADFGDAVRIKSLDFSNLLDARDACAFIERTRDLDYELVEAPARSGDSAGLAYVRDRALLPVSEHVYSDRWALELVTARAVDILNVGLFALGGITPVRRVLAIAEAAGLRCLVGTTQELSIGTAAAAHVGASASVVTVASDPVGPLLYLEDVVREKARYAGGELVVPTGPGLGVELDRTRLDAVAGPLSWSGGGVVDVIDRIGAPAHA